MESPAVFSNTLLQESFYLTDGGLETTLVYHYGIQLQHFAAFELLTHAEGRYILRNYFQPYLQIAQQYGSNFILETPTWRANTDWGFKMGYSLRELEEINRKAVQFLNELKQPFAPDTCKILISGNIGPRGDGYKAENTMSPEEAKAYHLPQISAFQQAGADLCTAMTLNYSQEAIGIVLAAREVQLPAVISFTLETDGRLPNGESLGEAIEKTDAETDGYAAHFMINCAHPAHFLPVLQNNADWKNRIQGIRANASTKSHAELDAADTLDHGDKVLLAHGYTQLKSLLPQLRIIGGCCGTDHSHLEEVCRAVM